MITANGLQQLGFKIDTDFVLQDDGAGAYIKEWNSASPQPTEAEIETAHAEWQAEYDSQEYARNRQAEYPEIGDQLDMLWHAIDTGDWTAAKVKTTEFYTALKAVKDANPK